MEFVWELTKETINLLLGCLQGGVSNYDGGTEQMDDARETTKEARGVLFKAYDTSQSLVMQVLAFSLSF